MRDLKTLRELVASVTDWKTSNMLSLKPFRPTFLDTVLSVHAPELYNKDELDQISYFFKLLSENELKSSTHNVKGKSQKRPIEEIGEEDKVLGMKKRAKEIMLTDNAPSPDLSTQIIEEIAEEERVVPTIILTNVTQSPDLPESIKNRVTELNGYDLKFLLQKNLFCSDVKQNNNRLSMPINEIKSEFLTEDEIEKLNKREGGRLVGIEVTVLDPCLREFTLQLKKWSMERTKTYNLAKFWNQIVSVNKFEVNQKLQIWSFRVQEKLYFLLNKLES